MMKLQVDYARIFDIHQVLQILSFELMDAECATDQPDWLMPADEKKVYVTIIEYLQSAISRFEEGS